MCVRHVQSPPDVVWSVYMKWVENQIRISLNGLVPTRPWIVTNVHGMKITGKYVVSSLTPFEHLLRMFPMSHLQKIIPLTNVQLSCRE